MLKTSFDDSLPLLLLTGAGLGTALATWRETKTPPECRTTREHSE